MTAPRYRFPDESLDAYAFYLSTVGNPAFVPAETRSLTPAESAAHAALIAQVAAWGGPEEYALEHLSAQVDAWFPKLDA